MKLRKIRAAGSMFAATAAFLALSGCMGPTYGTGKTAGQTMIDDLDGMFALGEKKNGDEISYSPRAELVRPKDTSVLPPPRDRVTTANDPSWPESPEVRSARIKAAADKRNVDGPISPDVLLAEKEGITDEQIERNSGLRYQRDDNKRTLSPQELDSSREAFQQRLRDSKQGSPTQRKYLSEPPVAYRQPAATAPVGDPGVDESVKQAKLKQGDDTGLGTKLRNLLPF